MLLTVPVSQADKNLIPTVIKAFSLLNPGLGHDLLIVGQSKVTAEINQLHEALSPYFRNSSNLILGENQNLGWPLEGNFLFQRTAFHVASHYPANSCFFWFELDCTPLKQNWLTELEKAYYADAEKASRENRPFKRYMGAKMATLQTRAGELVPTAEAGHHMAATGVYPINMAQGVKSLNAITSARVPFANFIQWYVLKELNDTPLIKDNWRTRNYRAQENVIFSENVSEHAFGIEFNEPIVTDSETLLVHGCKDESLLSELEKILDLKPIEPTPQGSPKLPEESFAPSIPQYQMPQIGKPRTLQNYAAPSLPAIATPANYRPPLVIPSYSREDVYQMPEGQKPLNSYAEGNSQIGQPVPKVEPRAPRIPEFTEMVEKSRELSDSIHSPEERSAVEVLLNDRSQAAPKKGKRGPGRPKKIKRQITPEDRERRAQRMREVAKKRWASNNESQPSQE